jgi:hypothetical protein
VTVTRFVKLLLLIEAVRMLSMVPIVFVLKRALKLEGVDDAAPILLACAAVLLLMSIVVR